MRRLLEDNSVTEMGFYTELSKVFKEYMLNSSLHGARFLVSDDYTAMEKYLSMDGESKNRF